MVNFDATYWQIQADRHLHSPQNSHDRVSIGFLYACVVDFLSRFVTNAASL